MNKDSQNTEIAALEVAEFHSKYVLPYRYLYGKELYEGVHFLLDLIVKEGHCSSIVSDEKVDSLYGELPRWAIKILSGVSLRQHSLCVAKIMIHLWKADNLDYEASIPISTMTALAHDIGKMPLYQKDPYYGGGDHALISSGILKNMLKDRDIHLLDRAIVATKEHHNIIHSGTHKFTIFLRQANTIAREIEIARNSDMKRMSWNQWFDPQAFLLLLRREINKIQDNNGYKAFTYGSTVYCQPTYLLEVAGELALQKGVIDLKLLKKAHQSDDQKEEALLLIVESLRKINAVVNIGEGYYGRSFQVEIFAETWTKRLWEKKMFLSPLKIESFGLLPSHLEKVKRRYPRKIKVTGCKRRPMGGN